MVRDKSGKFVKGHQNVSPGRPKKARKERYYDITMSTCTFDDWKLIVERAIKDAQKGDASARKWLSDYLVGVPDQPLSGGVEILVRYVGKTDD